MKIFSLLLIIVFSVSCTFEPSFAESQSEIRALNDLLSYVYYDETIHADVRWVIEAFKRFDREKNWESLQLARAALVIARRDIEILSLPKAEMTSEDRAQLMSHGIDLSFISVLETLFRADQITALNTFASFNNSIMYSVFFNEDWKNCMSNINLTVALSDLEIQSLAKIVDWVLASINDKAVSEKFSGLLEKHCPLTYAHLAKKQLPLEIIESSVHELQNKIKKTVIEGTKIIGAENHRVNLIEDALAKKDLSLLVNDIVEISGMPLMLPAPKWFSNEDIYYYWQENGNIVMPPQPRTKLERTPDGWRIRIKSVTPDAVNEYQEELRAIGVATSADKTFYKYYDSIFAITWDNGTTTIQTIEKPVCFVPRWYLTALRLSKRH